MSNSEYSAKLLVQFKNKDISRLELLRKFTSYYQYLWESYLRMSYSKTREEIQKGEGMESRSHWNQPTESSEMG